MKWILLALLASPLAAADEPAALAQQHFQSGLAYERLGRLDDSYTELQLASNLDSSNALMALAVGTVAFRLGRYDEALRALERSITLDANSCASYYEMGLIYEKKQMVDRALESWKRFSTLNQEPALKSEAQKHIQFLEASR